MTSQAAAHRLMNHVLVHLHRDQRGFTLTEMLVGLAIASVLIGMVGTAFYQFTEFTHAANDKMLALASLETADLWLAADSQEAESFAAGSGSVYGSFLWPRGDPEFEYSYDPVGRTLLRKRYDGGSLTSTNVVARDISDQSHVSFSASGQLVKVTITSTRGDESASAAWDLAMRVR